MKKTVFWMFVVFLMLAGGFLIPKWMLLCRYERVNDLHVTSDLTAQLTIATELDLLDRLSLIKDESVRLVGLEVTDEKAEEVYDILMEEMDKLLALGYESIPAYVEEFATYDMVNELVFIDSQHTMRVYEIRSVTAFALIDQESHKILSIASNVAPWDRAQDALKGTDGYESLYLRTLRAFAHYYGLELGAVSVQEGVFLNDGLTVVMSADFSDKNGKRIRFGLGVDELEGYCYVGTIPTEVIAEAQTELA